MLSEYDPRQNDTARFYGRELLDLAPPAFQKKIIQTLEHVSSWGGFQIMLFEVESEKVPLENGTENAFITTDGEYRESFHKAGGKTYHVLLTGDDSESVSQAIAKALGKNLKRSRTMSAEIAQEEGYPFRYRPQTK